MLVVPGAQLFTLEIGDGDNPRVVLHGGPGASHDYLRPQMDRVGHVLYYDQRGSGRSPLDPGTPPGGFREHVDDLERVRASLNMDQLDLVGYSWGALLAMLFAVEHPERVRKLALISPAPAAARERPEMQARLAEMGRRPSVEALRAKLNLSDRKNRFALAVAGYFADPARALELTPFLVQQRAEQAVWQSLGDYDLRPRLEKLKIPSLVAHGEEDPIPLATARATADALGAELYTFADCGHVPYVEAPDALFAALTKFLRD